MALAALPNIFLLLLAALFMGVTASNHGGKAGCIDRVDEAPPPGSCLCYDRCSNGGGGLMTAESQTCFVNCVLRQGCVCPGDGEVHGLPALLDGTVRVTVSRPRVSNLSMRRHDDMDEAEEEVLVVEVTFEGGEVPPFTIHVNAHGREFRQFEQGGFLVEGPKPTIYEIPTGKTRLRKPVRKHLEEIGAGGHRTVVVSFLPVNATWCAEHRVTIADVRIEYERTSSK